MPRIVYKISLYARLHPYAEKLIGEYQAGFRRGRSTVDQIFIVKQILRVWEYDIDVHNIFMYYKQAYDSTDRNNLYQILQQLKIPTKLVKIIKTTMCETETVVRVENQITDPFKITKGLKHPHSSF